MAAPKRELLKAAEVCEIANVQPYVLRSWEAEFPQLGRPSSGGGPRVYGRSDVEMVLRVKSLVFGEGLTLAGARRRLEEADDEPVDMAGLLPQPGLNDEALGRVRKVRDGLRGILDLLSVDPRPDLILSSPSPRRQTRGRRRSESPAHEAAAVE